LDPKEAEAFLNRPIKKLEDLNTSLKNSYEKNFFNRPQFSHFAVLKSKRKHKEADSIPEEEKSNDSDFKIGSPRNSRNKRAKGVGGELGSLEDSNNIPKSKANKTMGDQPAENKKKTNGKGNRRQKKMVVESESSIS
jgi:hypothetical protein